MFTNSAEIWPGDVEYTATKKTLGYWQNTLRIHALGKIGFMINFYHFSYILPIKTQKRT
jgi:hypothetical protein